MPFKVELIHMFVDASTLFFRLDPVSKSSRQTKGQPVSMTPLDTFGTT